MDRPGKPNEPGCGVTTQVRINIANPGDTILISAGDYTESLTLSKAVSVTGELSSTTILHALPNTRVLTVTGAAVNSSVVISGLTFTGGSLTGAFSCPDGCGGGILIWNSAQPRLEHLTVVSNWVDCSGGGVFIDSGSPLAISDASIISNTALVCPGLGGGIFAGDTISISGSLFQGNQAVVGGGLEATRAAVVTDTEFIDNDAHNGGGIDAAGILTATNTEFITNSTLDALGNGAAAGTARVQGGLFQGNSGIFGGGLRAGQAFVTGTRFIDNTALNVGGGLHTGSDRIVNALFAGNTTLDGQGATVAIVDAGTVTAPPAAVRA